MLGYSQQLPSSNFRQDVSADVCKDNLHNKCTRGNSCRFSHENPSVYDLAPVASTRLSSAPMGRMFETCLDWVHGKCTRETCRFIHSEQPLEQLNFCKDNLAGKCTRDSCRFYHGTQEQFQAQRSLLETQQYYQPAAPLMYAPRTPQDPAVIPSHICRDFVRGKCDREGCRYTHSDPASSTSGMIPSHVCRDFVRGKCARTDCRFSHSESESHKESASRPVKRFSPY